MKNNIRFLSCLILVFATVQFSSPVFAAKIKDQATLNKEIDLVTDLYLKGNYYEALSNIDIVTNKLKGKDGISNYIMGRCSSSRNSLSSYRRITVYDRPSKAINVYHSP